MAESKELVAPDLLTYENYNDLRKDVLDPTLGHPHLGGTDEGKKLSGAFIGGDADFGNFKIVNLGAPTASGDATNKGYVDPPNLAYLPLAGGTMTGPIIGITTLEADLLQIGGQEVIPPFWPFVGTDTTVADIAKCTIGYDLWVSVTTRGFPCTFGLGVASGYTVTFTFGYHYLTSSRPPEIWLQINDEGKLLSVCSCSAGMDIRPPLELFDQTAFLAEVLIAPSEYEELEKRARSKGTTVAMFVHKNVQLGEQTAQIDEFELRLNLKRKEEVRFTRWVPRIVKRIEKQRVPVIERRKIFNEMNGQWEEHNVQKVELVPQTRYRLKDPELGER